MDAKITDTLTTGINSFIEKKHAAERVAIEAGIDFVRVNILADTPVDTGALFDSIAGLTEYSINEIAQEGDVVYGIIGTSIPYAVRTEYGFTGADSLGREYNQEGQFFFSLGLEHASQGILRVLRDVLNYQLGL